MITIFWTVPTEVITGQITGFSKVRIERSSSEQTGYILIAEIDAQDVSANYVTSFTDVGGGSTQFYTIRYFNPLSNSQTGISTAFKELSPREVRLITQLKTFVPPIMIQTTTDNDLRNAILLAIQTFNISFVQTSFTLDTFPVEYESILLMGSQITLLLYKYLGISIRDFSYGDSGLSLNIDRGEKIDKALTQLLGMYNGILQVAKLNFATTGVGIGTVSLPIGLGGNLNRGILNVLNIFSTVGR